MEIVLTPQFAERRQEYLDDDHFHSLLRVFSVNPEYGMPLPRTEGLRRARWEFNLQQESDGVKVIYFWHSRSLRLHLLSIFPKELQDNLTNQQAAQLSRAINKVSFDGR